MDQILYKMLGQKDDESQEVTAMPQGNRCDKTVCKMGECRETSGVDNDLT